MKMKKYINQLVQQKISKQHMTKINKQDKKNLKIIAKKYKTFIKNKFFSSKEKKEHQNYKVYNRMTY